MLHKLNELIFLCFNNSRSRMRSKVCPVKYIYHTVALEAVDS